MKVSEMTEQHSLESCQANAQSIASAHPEAHIREQKEVTSAALLIYECLTVCNERTVEQLLRRFHNGGVGGWLLDGHGVLSKQLEVRDEEGKLVISVESDECTH